MFVFNENKVCTNPEVLIRIESNKNSDCYEITLAKDNTHWGMGYQVCGGRSLGSAHTTVILHSPEYIHKENVINLAIASLLNNAHWSLKEPISINNTKEHQNLAKKFIEWEHSYRNPQLTLEL